MGQVSNSLKYNAIWLWKFQFFLPEIVTFIDNRFNMIFIINHIEGHVAKPQYRSKHSEHTLLVLFANMNNIKSFLGNLSSYEIFYEYNIYWTHINLNDEKFYPSVSSSVYNMAIYMIQFTGINWKDINLTTTALNSSASSTPEIV